MRSHGITLYLGQYEVTKVAIRATSLPEFYKLALADGLTADWEARMNDQVPVEILPIRVAVFKRKAYTNDYYLVEIQGGKNE
jgi:hypothetical protein